MTSDLDQVRKILLGPEFDELLALKAEYNDNAQFAEHVSKIVTEALKNRSQRDDSVANVLTPTIDQAITSAIVEDPKKMAESLYPIMGPAIRKSISETMQQMMENFNQLLEQSLSPQSMRWRFDAWRTGRNYSELVLLNTLEYQVDQVFVIHRETSLLISHVESSMSDSRDPDMVSSMLSAIQDFVEDSFATNAGDQLDTLRLGDLSVVVARGPKAVLASVVRGSVPETLRGKMNESLEHLHRQKREELADFSGDPDDFADTTEDLHDLLEIKRKEEPDSEKKPPWLAIIAILIIVSVSGYFAYESHRAQQYKASQLALLEAEPGLVFLSQFKQDGKTILKLLKDPLAKHPESLLKPNEELKFIPEYKVYHHLSTDQSIVEQRARQALKPDSETDLLVENGVLALTGSATRQWLAQASQLATNIPGIESLEITNLRVYDPILDAFEALKQQVENLAFSFDTAEATLDGENPALTSLARDILEIKRLWLEAGGRNIEIDIVGYTDATGTAAVNRRIGLTRANALKSYLTLRGVDAASMSVHYGPDYEAQAENDRATRIKIRSL